MAIGPTIENLRKKRAEEAALVAQIQALRPYDTLTQGPEATVTQSITDFLTPIYEQVTGLSPRSSRYEAEKLSGLMDFLPVVGGGISAAQAKRDFDQGNYGSAALNAGFSLLDMIPAVAALRGGVKPAIAAIPSDARRLGQNVREFLAGESGSVPLPFSSSDPTAERGAQIIDMLTSGRANEITDQMLDMGDPVLNANLNQYLYRNYDLPMDEASRMARAREMGFNRNVYHGDAYSEKRAAFNRPNERAYFTYDPEDAGDYASYWTNSNPEKGRLFGEGAQIQNVMVRAQNRAQADDVADAYEYVSGKGVDGLDVSESWGPLHPDWSSYSLETADELRKRGFDSVFHADDSTPLSGEYIDSIAILNPPTNIRSQFARFDPRLAHLRNLSAGVAPFGLLALQPNEEQY